MKVLVTGCTGFVGTKLVSKLIMKGHEVTGLSRGHLCIESRYIRYIKKDIIDINVSDLNGIEVVIHLAAVSDLRNGDPEEIVRTNFKGFRALMDAVENSDVNRVLFASSGSVYGSCDLATEESPTNPKNMYATSKLSNELRAIESGVETVAMRFSNIYGASGRKDSLIPKLIECVKNDSEFTIYGTGENTSDYISINDAVRAIVHILHTKSPSTLNVSSGVSLSVNDIIKKFELGSGSKIRTRNETRSEAEVDHVSIQNKELQSLGFRINESIEAFIEESIPDTYHNIFDKTELRVLHEIQGTDFEFTKEVDTIHDAVNLLEALAEYDEMNPMLPSSHFLLQKLQMWDDEPEVGCWVDWRIHDGEYGYFDDPTEFVEVVLSYNPKI